jgi:hypothetical protein
MEKSILEHYGHAPQIEKAAAANRLYEDFIQSQALATSVADISQTLRY